MFRLPAALPVGLVLLAPPSLFGRVQAPGTPRHLRRACGMAPVLLRPLVQRHDLRPDLRAGVPAGAAAWGGDERRLVLPLGGWFGARDAAGTTGAALPRIRRVRQPEQHQLA